MAAFVFAKVLSLLTVTRSELRWAVDAPTAPIAPIAHRYSTRVVVYTDTLRPLHAIRLVTSVLAEWLFVKERDKAQTLLVWGGLHGDKLRWKAPAWASCQIPAHSRPTKK